MELNLLLFSAIRALTHQRVANRIGIFRSVFVFLGHDIPCDAVKISIAIGWFPRIPSNFNYGNAHTSLLFNQYLVDLVNNSIHSIKPQEVSFRGVSEKRHEWIYGLSHSLARHEWLSVVPRTFGHLLTVRKPWNKRQMDQIYWIFSWLSSFSILPTRDSNPCHNLTDHRIFVIASEYGRYQEKNGFWKRKNVHGLTSFFGSLQLHFGK